MRSRPTTPLDLDALANRNRRQMQRSLGTSALLAVSGGLLTRSAWSQPTLTDNVFTLGVASGDPAPDGFVIWTKLAPKPLERGGGMPGKPVEVEWVVAASVNYDRRTWIIMERRQKTV